MSSRSGPAGPSERTFRTARFPHRFRLQKRSGTFSFIKAGILCSRRRFEMKCHPERDTCPQARAKGFPQKMCITPLQKVHKCFLRKGIMQLRICLFFRQIDFEAYSELCIEANQEKWHTFSNDNKKEQLFITAAPISNAL